MNIQPLQPHNIASPRLFCDSPQPFFTQQQRQSPSCSLQSPCAPVLSSHNTAFIWINTRPEGPAGRRVPRPNGSTVHGIINSLFGYEA
jgi:hypothetical protein